MGKIGDLWVRLGLKKDEFTAGLESAERQSQTFSQKVGSAFSGLATKALALTAAIAAIARGLSEAIRNVAQFERANSELAAVLGTTLKGVEGLSKSAKELGRTSEFTASEVTQLQIALARLGFDTGQIEDMQSSVLKFALAMRTDLGSAAEFTGSALRAFGLESTDTKRLLDVMSASTTNSALNFSKLQTSVAYVFPIAKEFGLTIEETAAFLGVLSNNGYDASMAATALRSILVNLTSDNGKFAKGIGHTAKSFDEIIASFAELREKGIQLGETNDLVGQRAVGAMAALIRQGESVTDLKKKLEEANGSLEKMSDTMTDNLVGSVKALKSAWEGLTLAFEGSKGPMKWVVDRLTDIINRLTDIITKTEKISGWEMILGPVVGGAIAGGKKRKQQAPEPYTGPAQSAVSLLRGKNQQQTTTTGGTHPLTEEEIEKLRKAQEKAERERLQALRDEAAAIAEVREADEAYAEQAGEMLKEFERAHELQPIQIFDNDTLAASAELLRQAVIEGEELNREAGMLGDWLDRSQDKLNDKLSGTLSKVEELSRAISEELVSAIEDGLVGAFDALADVLGGVTEGGMQNVVKALLEPLADMAVKAGTLIMMSGTAIEALKTSLTNFFGGSAVVAGAALVGVGIAAKAGLAALGNRGAGATAVTSYGGSGVGYGGGGVQTAELVVRVEGEVKGSSIVLAGQNTINSWNNKM